MTRGRANCWFCGRGLVAGWCSGYGRKCGRYFCAAHQIGDYCQECGEWKAKAERQAQFLEVAEQLWQDRQRTRNRAIELAAFAISLLLFAGGVVLAIFADIGGAFLLLSVFLVLFLAGLWRRWGRAYRAKTEQNRVQEIEQDYPGFATFYGEWSEDKLRTSG